MKREYEIIMENTKKRYLDKPRGSLYFKTITNLDFYTEFYDEDTQQKYYGIQVEYYADDLEKWLDDLLCISFKTYEKVKHLDLKNNCNCIYLATIRRINMRPSEWATWNEIKDITVVLR